MSHRRIARWSLIILLALLALAAAGLHFGARVLKSQVEAALGADSEIGELRLGWNAVEVVNLRIKAPQGWPAPDALRAKRIRIEPDFLTLLSPQVKIAAISVDEAYVSALRTTDGRLRVVPSLLEREGAKEGGAGPTVAIGRVELRDAVLEFFDATVRKPPHLIRLEQFQARIGPLDLPGLATKTELQLEGVLKGLHRNGTIAIKGWMEMANRESVIDARFQGVDLVALQPYLVKAAETGVKKGSLDLDVKSTIRQKQLHAPGTVTLSNLELDSASGTFMGMPRQAVVGLMKDHEGRITVKFALEGNLDDPQFKLNEGFATRFAASFADTLGVSVEGLVKGVGSIGQKGAEAAGGAAKGVGKALKGLFN